MLPLTLFSIEFLNCGNTGTPGDGIKVKATLLYGNTNTPNMDYTLQVWSKYLLLWKENITFF